MVPGLWPPPHVFELILTPHEAEFRRQQLLLTSPSAVQLAHDMSCYAEALPDVLSVLTQFTTGEAVLCLHTTVPTGPLQSLDNAVAFMATCLGDPIPMCPPVALDPPPPPPALTAASALSKSHEPERVWSAWGQQCPVTFVVDRVLRVGKDEFSVAWQGFHYCFVSRDAQLQFLEDPKRCVEIEGR